MGSSSATSSMPSTTTGTMGSTDTTTSTPK
jgi:hypothetical protein